MDNETYLKLIFKSCDMFLNRGGTAYREALALCIGKVSLRRSKVNYLCHTLLHQCGIANCNLAVHINITVDKLLLNCVFKSKLILIVMIYHFSISVYHQVNCISRMFLVEIILIFA